MTLPEIIAFSENPDADDDHYEGFMFRFDGAEHIAIAGYTGEIIVSMSTVLGPGMIDDLYTSIFGVRPVIDESLVIEDELSDRSIRGDESLDLNHETAMYIGTTCVTIAHTADFRLVWFEPGPIFEDRDEELAQVYMRQAGELDFRHTALIAELVQKNVKKYLDRIPGLSR